MQKRELIIYSNHYQMLLRLFLFLQITQVLNESCFCQNGIYSEFTPSLRVTYQFRFIPDTTNRNYFSRDSFYLFINTEKSLFLSINKFYNDSILISSTKDNLLQSQAEILTNLNYVTPRIKPIKNSYTVEKSLHVNEIKVMDNIALDVFFYNETFKNFSWQLSNTYEVFKGVSFPIAYVSFRGRKYKALYANEIPYSDGPYKFYGLPGLIVKISDEKEEVIFEMEGIEYYQNTVALINLNKPQKVTREVLRKLKMDDYLNPFTVAENLGPKITVDDAYKAETIAKRKKMAEKFSNKIELD